MVREESRATLIPVDGVELPADLSVPGDATGVVLFAHGSGSSRRSPRNMAVAHVLNRDGLATVLVDLLTEAEEEIDAGTAELRFDIGLLTRRLVGIVDWLNAQPALRDARIGIFGASTGAAGALAAAAARPGRVAAVVSRGGRPDLAGPALDQVRAPTLLLVGGRDEQVRQLNEQALRALPDNAELRVVPGATHLFEEPGALEEVAHAASTWFAGHLVPGQLMPGR
ncbi:dienelactone hydrolase family protein [Micromonospora echinofusca]|uniref:dienelactone hydrolase family protein n=1 Tax=Micromonospora echinofusca TaxID=47858 RepID=UPI0027DDA0A5|nr:dienelactone hydrolase family protein [Micromonospora echinofusca]